VIDCSIRVFHWLQVGVPLSPIDETKLSADNSSTQGKHFLLILIGFIVDIEEANDNGSHDQVNSADEQGWFLW